MALRLLPVLLLLLSGATLRAAATRHFIYFDLERDRIREAAFLSSRAEGAQLKYTWSELEPQKGRYDFSAIRRDYAFLHSKGKKLFVQLQDVSFHDSIVNVPAETSVVFGETGKLFPAGFTHESYRDGILANLAALREAFPQSVKIQYANFMPGEWLPRTNKGYLESVYRRAAELGVGVGGPDLLPYRKAQMNHGYPRLETVAGKIPTSIAVQDGNYEYVNPETDERVTLDEL